MINRFSTIARWSLLSLTLSVSTAQIFAQETNAAPAPATTPAPAAASTPAAAPAPAAPTVDPKTVKTKDPTADPKDYAGIAARLSDLEAYVTNGSRVQDASPAVPLSVYKSVFDGLPGPGHNAWMMTSSALVLFMTLPGLALFYGGLVRKKNVLSILAQCFGTAGLVSVLWWAFGYSLVFHNNATYSTWSLLGDGSNFFYKGISSAPNTNYCSWVAENVYSIFQLTFAIITPALIIGGVAERIKFSAIMIFIGAWMFIVYFPLAHAVWGIDGAMNGVWNANAPIKAIDFAGGTVVHMSSGYSALILALIIGRRKGFGKAHFTPHSAVLVMIGASMLWVGWYGFNAGSAGAADVVASNAFTTTTLATAFAAFVWAVMEFLFRGKSTVVGFSSGAVAGLVVITPACGFVDSNGAVVIGVAAGILPFLASTYLKALLKYDDALDVFGVHAIGGTTGALLTGVLATASVNANLNTNLKDYLSTKALGYNPLVVQQLYAVLITIALAVIGTAIIGYALKFTIGLRPTEEQEEVGLDLTDHGEEGYVL